MATYSIPVYIESFERQKKAARLLHFLAGFLMMANAWGNFNQPTPNLLFVVIQIFGALLAIAFAFSKTSFFRKNGNINSVLRFVEAIVFLYAAWYFTNVMHLNFMSILQVSAAAGLLLMFFSEKNLFSPSPIKINDKGLHLPTSFKTRFIRWADIDHLLVKSDFVSINTIRNQFIQYETNILLSELEMDEINAFAREHFTKK